MSSVVGSLETALQTNKLEQVSLIMDRFETQVENMGVQTAYMDTAMAGSTSLSTPEDQVMGLMQQVADEHGLELKQQLGNVPMSNRGVMRRRQVRRTHWQRDWQSCAICSDDDASLIKHSHISLVLQNPFRFVVTFIIFLSLTIKNEIHRHQQETSTSIPSSLLPISR